MKHRPNWFVYKGKDSEKAEYLVSEVYLSDLEKALSIRIWPDTNNKIKILRVFNGSIGIENQYVNAYFVKSFVSSATSLVSFSGEGADVLNNWLLKDLKRHKTKYMLRQLTNYLYNLMMPMLIVFQWIFIARANWKGLLEEFIIFMGMMIVYRAVRR